MTLEKSLKQSLVIEECQLPHFSKFKFINSKLFYENDLKTSFIPILVILVFLNAQFFKLISALLRF